VNNKFKKRNRNSNLKILTFLVMALSAFWLFTGRYYLAISFMILLFVIFWFLHASKKWRSVVDMLYDLPFFVVLTSPIITYVMINVISEYVHKNPGILPIQGNTSDWIGFSGSIIGGALTIYAVVFSLQYQDDIRKKDIEFQIMPIIQANELHHMEYNDNEGLSFEVLFENISNYPMKNLKLVYAKSKYNSKESEIDPTLIRFSPVNFLTGGKIVSRIVMFPFSFIPEYEDEVLINLIFEYQDIKGSQAYRLTTKIDIAKKIRDERSKTTYFTYELENDFVWEE